MEPHFLHIISSTAFQGSNSINNSSADNSSQSRQSLGASTAGNNIKASYLVALLGDSMTDTLGFDFSYLNALLKGAYPNASHCLKHPVVKR